MPTLKPFFILFILAGAFIQCTDTESEPRVNTAIIPLEREGWAYDRFLALNDTVQKYTGNIDLLFIGESLTSYWEREGLQIWEEYYGERVAVNIGVGGDRTENVLWRLQNGNVDGLHPKVTVLKIGTNNTGSNWHEPGEILEGIYAVIELIFQKMPDTQLIVMGILPRSSTFSYRRAKIAQVNQVLVNLQKRENIHHIDIGHKYLLDDGSIPQDLMYDFLHLTEEGYRIWAEALEPLIDELLGEN